MSGLGVDLTELPLAAKARIATALLVFNRRYCRAK
jgi:hypothetical protein